MFLLDKPFIIFIAREHDRQEEKNTIRSERRTAWVSWYDVFNFDPREITGGSEIKGLTRTEICMFCCWGFNYKILFKAKHLVRAHYLWLNLHLCYWWVGGVVWIKLSEVHSKSLPGQICIIVAITNAIITGVDHRTEREEDDVRRKERRGCALALPFHATCDDHCAKLTLRANSGTKNTKKMTTKKMAISKQCILPV